MSKKFVLGLYVLASLVFAIGGWFILDCVRTHTSVSSTPDTEQTPSVRVSTPFPTQSRDQNKPFATQSEDKRKLDSGVSQQVTDLITPGSPFFIKNKLQDELSQDIQQLKESKKFENARNKAQLHKNTEYCSDPEILIGKNNDEIKSKQPYAIAVVVPLTNEKEDTKYAAIEILRGVAQAQDKYNKQQPTKPLKVFIVNEEDKSKAGSIAHYLVNNSDQKKILGVIGHYTSDATNIAAPIYNGDGSQDVSKRLVVISPTSTKTEIKNQHKYFFRTLPNNEKEAEALVNYIQKNQNIQPKKAAIIFNKNSDFSKSLMTEFEYSFKNNKIIKQNSVNTYDINNIQEKLINDSKINENKKNFSVLMLAVTVDDISTIYLSELQNDNAQKFFYLGGDTIYVPEKLTKNNSDIPKRLRNIVIAVPWHYTLPSAESQTFVKETSKLWCQEPGKEDNITWQRATTYDATRVLIQAIEYSNFNKQTVQQKLLDKEFSMRGITGTIKFKDNGDLNAPSRLVRLFEENISERKYKFKLVDETGNPQS